MLNLEIHQNKMVSIEQFMSTFAYPPKKSHPNSDLDHEAMDSFAQNAYQNIMLNPMGPRNVDSLPEHPTGQTDSDENYLSFITN